MEKEENYIKQLGDKEYLNELWEVFQNTWDYIDKRLKDIWNHPTLTEVTWFHKQWDDLTNDVKRYFEAEALYLPMDECSDELKMEEGKDYVGAGFIEGKHAFVKEFDVAPTTILSNAIEQVEQMGNYKVMMALVDLDDAKPKEERLYTFCDIESKKLRNVIYSEMEKEFE